MRYELNVGYEGDHVFATHSDSILSIDKAKVMYTLFMQRFPPHEGWGVSVYRIEASLYHGGRIADIGVNVTAEIAAAAELPVGITAVEHGVI